MTTDLVCLRDTYLYEMDAAVLSTGSSERGEYAILDKTIFYPQGGGQPADRGTISQGDTRHSVTFVEMAQDGVRHYVEPGLSANLVGLSVSLEVDSVSRMINARNHSAGHIIGFLAEAAVTELHASKGYHFNDGPYVEFAGSAAISDVEEFRAELERMLDQCTEADIPIETFEVSYGELASLCTTVPDYIPEGKPTRVMKVGDNAYPCGGTHVSRTGEIGRISIRKMKSRKGVLRISYEVA